MSSSPGHSGTAHSGWRAVTREHWSRAASAGLSLPTGTPHASESTSHHGQSTSASHSSHWDSASPERRNFPGFLSLLGSGGNKDSFNETGSEGNAANAVSPGVLRSREGRLGTTPKSLRTSSESSARAWEAEGQERGTSISSPASQSFPVTCLRDPAHSKPGGEVSGEKLCV